MQSTPTMLTASFDREVRLRTEALGQGSVDPIEAWYPEGAIATFSAVPAAHWMFNEWVGIGDGSYSGTNNPASAVMTSPITEQAQFEVVSYPVTMTCTEGGTILPPTGMYPGGFELTIQARPDDAHEFAGWFGEGPGSYTGPDSVATTTPFGPVQQHAVFELKQPGYEFRISSSETDPMENSAMPTGTWRPLYLWAVCGERGISAVEAETSTSFEGTGFQVMNGVLNAGSGNHLLLAVPGCPIGSEINFLLGYWYVLDEGGTMCLVPASESGEIAVVDCEVPVPFLWSDPYVIGFTSAGGEPCVSGLNYCGPESSDPDDDGIDEPPTAATELDLPASTRLLGPRPNPFDREVSIAFELARACDVSIVVYDVQGRRVRELVEDELNVGSHSIHWNGRDSGGQQVRNGIYFIRFVAGDVSQSKRVVLLER
jgi:hypothetical protein